MTAASVDAEILRTQVHFARAVWRPMPSASPLITTRWGISALLDIVQWTGAHRPRLKPPHDRIAAADASFQGGAPIAHLGQAELPRAFAGTAARLR